MIRPLFSAEHAVEVILFIARSLDDPDLHGILKMCYFADQLHLSKYGFLASGDDYKAMAFGPVASHTYDILKAVRGDQNPYYDAERYKDVVGGAFEVYGKQVIPHRGPNEELLSHAEKQCLTDAIAQHGQLDFNTRTAVSHDQAYEKAWAIAKANGLNAYEITIVDIAKIQPNAEDILDHLNS